MEFYNHNTLGADILVHSRGNADTKDSSISTVVRKELSMLNICACKIKFADKVYTNKY